MSDTAPLRPASPEEIAQALAHGLQYEGRRRIHHADNLAAQIAAERLVRYLERSGFVVMKKPPTGMHSASVHPHPHRD